MSSRLSLRVLAVFVLFTLIIPLALIANEVYGDGDDDPYSIPEKAEQKYPNLGSSLNQMVARVETRESSAEEAAKEAPVHQGSAVAVTIYLSGNVDGVVAFLEDNGGDPRNVGDDYIEAYVPVTLLGPVSERPGVLRVREIVPPQPEFGPITSQGVQAHGSQPWNNTGYSGQGVKVGVIDSFEGLRSLMGTELPATVVGRCYTDVAQYSSNLAACESGSSHGTAVAEAIVDVAPEVALYIANPISPADLSSTVRWMADQEVTVINRSASRVVFEGPGDGTSDISNNIFDAINYAADNGIVWVNSAGNYATQTWFNDSPVIHSVTSSTSNTDVVAFDGFDDFLNRMLGPSGDVKVILRWDDRWGGASSDLDLLLWDTIRSEFVADSGESQTGQAGDIPLETVDHELVEGRLYGIVVVHRSGRVPDWVQVMVRGAARIEHSTENGSINNPSESANPGMLAVGASHYWDSNTIADYSSRGPTPDGRVKPDIVGTACAETASYEIEPPQFYGGNNCWFAGTSQAAPHVAGMAALVRQRFPDYTPGQVADYLKENAEQRESPDPNNTWGHGFAQLGALPVQTVPDAPTITSITSGNTTLSVIWAAPATNEGAEITDYDLRYIPTDDDETVDANWSLVNSAWTTGGGNLEYTITELSNDTQYDVQARAVNSVGPSDWSATMTGTPLVTTPDPTDPCEQPLPAEGTVTGTWAAGCESEARTGSYARYYTFTLGEDSDVTITLARTSGEADTYLNLWSGSSRTGDPVDDDDDTPDRSRSEITRNLAAGDYTVEATTFEAGETGSFTLTVSGLGDAAPGPSAGECEQPLPAEGTVTGTWAAGCESEARTGSYARYYTFTLGEDSDVTITLARTSGEADTYLNLWSGSSRTGDPVDDDDDTPDRSRSEITRNLAAGDYTVEATTFASGETGSFTLTVSGLGGTATEPTDPDPGETDSCGETLSGDGTVTGTWAAGCESEARTGSYARYYTFTVGQESDVTITLARTSGGADTYLNLWSGSSRTGSPLDDDDDTPDTSRSEITRNLAAGDYTVEATTFTAGETGSFTLTVSGLGGTATEPTDPDPGETDSCGETLSGDGTVTGTWAAGCESEARTGSYARYYTFTVGQESDVTITLARTSGGADTYLNLWSGSSRTGSPLDDDDDTPDTSRSEITRNLAAGDYTVEATTFTAGETGSFTLTVSGLGGTATEPTDPDPGETDSCGETLSGDGTVTGTWAAGCESEARTGSYARYYTFTVGQESDVTITLARTSGGADTYLNLWSGSSRTGSPLDDDDDTPDTSRSEITRNLAAGDYTVEATTFTAGETGSFTLTVSGLGGTATEPTDPDPGETDSCGETLSGDGTVTGTWAAGCESEARTGSYARYYTFTVGQESDVTITLARTSGGADTYLNLWSGSSRTGSPLDDDDDTPDTSRSEITRNLAAGDYTVEATTFTAGETGSFTLTVSGLGGTATEPPTGDTVSEREALTALYNATDGANWENSSGWLTNAPLDQWYGVTTDDNGRVIEVDLLSNGLTGSVPAEVGNLYNLTLLRLDRNLFTGTLPSELGNLTNLNHLSITHSEIEGGLTGEIPPELGNLTELDTLYLGGHDLSGELPTELNNLTNLEQLVLWGNQFNGAIPSWMGNLTQLLRLELRSNQFSGPIPSELGNLTEMTRLQLGNNMLSGPIPTEMGNLRFLHILWLNDNQLTGSIPTQLENLTLLESLYLGGNQFTGCIPAALFAVPDNDLTRLYDLSACSS